MDWMLFFSGLGALAAVLALIGVAFTVIGYFRKHPKRQLLYSVTSRPLITKADLPEVRVTVGDETISNPHLVEFRMTSASRADIPSTAFDAGSPIEIKLKYEGVVVAEHANGITISSWDNDWLDGLSARINPQLIKRGSTLAIDIVADGKDEVDVHAPLIDVKVRQVAERRTLLALTDGILASGLIPFTAALRALVRSDPR